MATTLELLDEINDVTIGGTIELNGNKRGMDINQIVESIYKLSNNLQAPIYVGQKPQNPPKGAIYINIEE